MRAALISLFLLGATMLVVVAPALGAQVHSFSSTFGEEGSGEGQFKEPSGIAVNDATGDVYVVDKGNNRVQQFSSAGVFIAQFDGSAAPTGALVAPSAIAIDNTGNPLDPSDGDVYVVDGSPQVIYKFSASGVYLGQIGETEAGVAFGGIFGVAVDTSGGLWVYQASSEIDSFNNELANAFLSSRPSPFGASQGFAVDSEDNLYVNRGSEVFGKLNASGEVLVQEVDSEPSTATAVNLSTNDVYIYNVTGHGSSIAAFDQAPSCTASEPCQTAPPASLIERFGSEQLTGGRGLAVNSANGTLYATSANQVAIFGAVTIPDVTTGSVSNLQPTSATLNGTVNPDAIAVSDCHFEYGESEGYGQSVPCVEDPGSGTEPVSVHADIASLQPAITYHFRLVATNANGTNHGLDQHFTTPGAGLKDEAVTSVTGDSATLQASVNPNNAPTSYYFQYGTSTGYGTDVPAPPGVALGSGAGQVPVGQHLQGLQSQTIYHFRVVAISELSPGQLVQFDGADQVFITQGPGGELLLPDERDWELVSPPDKRGALIRSIGASRVIQAAASGGAITYVASVPTEAHPQGNTNLVQVLSTRAGGGWGSQNIAIPHDGATGLSIGRGQEYRAFSSDLSLGVLNPFGKFMASLSEEASEQTAYLRSDYLNGDPSQPCSSDCYHPLVTGCPPPGQACSPSVAEHANVPAGTVFGGEVEGKCPEFLGSFIACGPKFRGATPDMSHIVLTSQSAGLTPGTSGGLYEWAGGQLTFIGASEEIRPFHAISDDGARVVFDGKVEGHNGLLLRDTAIGKTVQLDAVQGGSGKGPATPQFQFASSDGSKVFFTDRQRLTANSGGEGEGEEDLYECVMMIIMGVLECGLSDLTPLIAGKERARVLGGILGASKDGSWVYFMANGALAPGAVQGGCGNGGLSEGQPPPGSECNLYALHHGAGGWEAPRLVAVLSGEDVPDWKTILEKQTARVSPDGRWLTFMSQQSLTGYDNRDAVSGKRDEEVYLYHASEAGAGSLVCASCNPTGARPLGVENGVELRLASGEGVWKPERWLAGDIPTWTSYELHAALYQSRFLSNSGRLFFNARDALVPQDVDGTEDVYQYEPPGVGGCTSSDASFSERSGGCVGLISSGSSTEESAFLDASENGSDVFFLTAAKLSGQDSDTSLDVYDAHECTTASPCLAPAPPKPLPCSTGDACKPSPSPQPSIFGSPASATFSGAGNLTPASPGQTTGKPKPPSRAQLLARALKTCRAKHNKHKRAVCESQARKRYGSKAKKSARANRRAK